MLRYLDKATRPLIVGALVVGAYSAGLYMGRPAPAAAPTAPAATTPAVPAGCRQAVDLLTPPLTEARDALKGLLKGEARPPHRDALASAELAVGEATAAAEVNAALLDCGSADLDLSQVYDKARAAVQTANLAVVIGGAGAATPPMIEGYRRDLAAIEHALAQP